MTETTVAEVMAELAALEEPKVRAVNEKHGDDHGVNLTKLRAVAKRLKVQQDLAVELWQTKDSAARLLALLICRPKLFAQDELDTMLREASTPKVQDWLVNYVVKKNPHVEDLRVIWMADPDPVVESAGWALTTERVAKKPDGLDLAGLLDVIEARMKDAPDRLQWAMNHCLAQIGIEHPQLRARALGIGERLRCSRTIRRRRAARRRSPRSGSPRWSAARTADRRVACPGPAGSASRGTRDSPAPAAVSGTWTACACSRPGAGWTGSGSAGPGTSRATGWCCHARAPTCYR